MIGKTTIKRRWLTKALSITALCLCGFLSKTQAQEQIVFSEWFTNPDNDISECSSWQTFSQQLTADKNYLSVLFKGSNNETGLLLDDPAKAAELAAAIHNNQSLSFTAHGQFWMVTPADGSVYVNASALGNTHGGYTCVDGAEYFVVRACLENGNYGGIGGPTCGTRPDQRIDLIFSYGGVELVNSTPATCLESSDGALTVKMNGGIAPYTFEWSNGVTTTSGQPIPDYTLLGHFEDHSYYRRNTAVGTFAEAQANSLSHFGYLASINTAEENAWLTNNGIVNGDLIGGSDAAQEGVWTWASGEPFIYTNWAPAEPNNSGGNQDYTQIYTNGTWDDIDWPGSVGARHITEVVAVSQVDNLDAGDYTVTVTDAEGTIYTGTFKVGPDPIEIEFAMTPTSSCDESVNDGALAAIVTGGNAPYTYVWSSGETTASIAGKTLGDYTLTVTDAHECPAVQNTGTITPDDAVDPTILTKNATIYLDENGAAQISVEDVDNGSFDDCDIVLSLGQSAYDCSHVITEAPSFEGEAALQLDGTDDYLSFLSTIPQSPNHTIAAWIKTSVINTGIFGWGGTGVNNYAGMAFQGGTIRYYAGNGAPPMQSVSGSTSVSDGNWHHVAVSRSITGEVKIYVDGNLDGSGSVTKYVNAATTSSVGAILANGIYQLYFNGAMDEFAFWSNVLSEEEVSQLACNGPVNPDVYLRFEDGAGSSTASDFSGNGNHAILSNMDINGSWIDFGAPVPLPNCLPEITTTLIGEDPAGNVASATAVITVLDTISPVAVVKNHTIYINSDGEALLNPSDLDNGSTDNCAVAEFTASKTAFNCSNLGMNDVVLTAADISGNTGSASAQVEVLDIIAPSLEVQNIEVNLDANGVASITTADLEVSAADNCQIASKALSIDAFSCEDLGQDIEVIFTLTDNSGNQTQKTALVSVVESIAPVAVAEDYTVELGADGSAALNAALVAQFIGSGSTDNCSIDPASHALSQMTFACEDLGTNELTYSVADPSGNTDTAPVTITVVDIIAPVAVARNITAELDADGMVTIAAEDADDGSTDNCAIASRELNIYEFSCEDIGEHTVTLTVSDASGNQSQALFTVTVVDNMAPTIPESLSLNIYLDENGEAPFNTAPLLAEADDNCGLDAIVAQVGFDEFTDMNGFPLTCEEIGTVQIPLFARDNSGNLTNFVLDVTVLDTIKPSFNLQSIELVLNEEGNAVLTQDMLWEYASDACGVAEVAIQVGSFDCSQAGVQFTEIIVFDMNGNATQQTLEVILTDTIAPEVQVENITIELNENGLATLNADALEMVATDNCAPAGFALSQTEFSCADLGTQELTVTVMDAAGNSAVAAFSANVVDNTAPVIAGPEVILVCQGLPVNYDEIVATDNCAAELTVIDGPLAGTTPEVGEHMVEFEAVDPSGNAVSKLVLLTVAASPVVDLGPDMEVEAGTLVTLVAGDNDANTYLWSTENAGPEYQFTATEDVLVSVEVITPDGCAATDEILIEVSNPVGVKDEAAGTSLSLYPNPTKGQISIALSLTEVATDVKISIIDLTGKTLAQQLIPTVIDGDVLSIDLSGYADGIYLVNMQSDAFTLTKRVVKH